MFGFCKRQTQSIHSAIRVYNVRTKLHGQIYYFKLSCYPNPPIYLNNVEIPPAAIVKYLGLYLDTKLDWKYHIIKKRKQMEIRHK
jgi:hypothetical protein